MKFTIKDIAKNAIIMALYVALTSIALPISFGMIQIRVAEILILVVFFNRKYIPGLVLGCALANLFSSIGFIDVLFGSIATLLACLAIGFSKHLLIACVFPVIFNAFIVGLELNLFMECNFWLAVGYVALGESIVMVFSYVVFMLLKKNDKFFTMISRNRNIDFKW